MVNNFVDLSTRWHAFCCYGYCLFIRIKINISYLRTSVHISTIVPELVVVFSRSKIDTSISRQQSAFWCELLRLHNVSRNNNTSDRIEHTGIFTINYIYLHIYSWYPEKSRNWTKFAISGHQIIAPSRVFWFLNLPIYLARMEIKQK